MINAKHINFDKTGKFPAIFLDFLCQKEALKPFSGLFPEIDNYQVQLKNKKFAYRQVLYQALNRQYDYLDKKPQLALDLLLQENTFTVTTGHQLNIFSGPLYFHYKILTVINAAKALRKRFPTYNFVPVYWMASEDHDAQEIASFRLFGKTYTWNYEQKGAVGRFLPHSLSQVMDSVSEMHPLFRTAYQNYDSLADSTRYFVNELYGTEGLVVIDGDDKELKNLFKEKMQSEVFGQISHKAVSEQSEKLKAAGYLAQVFPREINLFYLDKDLRERIVPENEGFRVLNTDIFWDKAQMQAQIEQNPEKFSPNVILRPLYQETILPNLSYTGGPGEMAYWLQLKSTFEAFQVPFPILLPRNFALLIGNNELKKIQKFAWDNDALFKNFAYHKEHYIRENTQQEFGLEQEIDDLKHIFEKITQKSIFVDASLEGFVKAEEQRILASIDKIQKRIQKAEEQKHETALKQIENLLEKLFPNGGLQERTDNFLNFYLNNPHFLSQISTHFDPFDFRMLLLELA